MVVSSDIRVHTVSEPRNGPASMPTFILKALITNTFKPYCGIAVQNRNRLVLGKFKNNNNIYYRSHFT